MRGGITDDQAAGSWEEVKLVRRHTEASLLGFQLMQRIREDLAKSKVVDAVMRPSAVENLTVVLALALEFLPEGTLENLLSGDFSVKVTRIVEGDEEISLYQRTVFSYLSSADIDAIFVQLRQTSKLRLSQNPSSVKAPALQVMPLAIYA